MQCVCVCVCLSCTYVLPCGLLISLWHDPEKIVVFFSFPHVSLMLASGKREFNYNTCYTESVLVSCAIVLPSVSHWWEYLAQFLVHFMEQRKKYNDDDGGSNCFFFFLNGANKCVQKKRANGVHQHRHHWWRQPFKTISMAVEN